MAARQPLPSALHPGSGDAAYAQFLIASSYFEEIPDITRDQGRTEKAMQALEEVARNLTGAVDCEVDGQGNLIVAESGDSEVLTGSEPHIFGIRQDGTQFQIYDCNGTSAQQWAAS